MNNSFQLLSHVRLFATPWIAACQASLSITNSWSSPKPMSIELVMPSSHLILCHPLLLLPPIPPSIRVFSNESSPPQKTSYPLAIILHSPFSLNPSNTNFFLLSSWVSLFWIFHINHIIYSLLLSSVIFLTYFGFNLLMFLLRILASMLMRNICSL